MDLNRSCSSCKPFDHLEFKECDYDIKVHFISFVFWPNWKWFCKSIVTIYAMQWTTEIETQIDKFSNSFDFVCQPVSQFSSHLLILYSHWDLFIHEFNLFIQKCLSFALVIRTWISFFLFCFHVLFIQIILVDLNPISFSVSHMFAFKLLGFSSSAVGGALQPQWGRKSWPKMDKYTQTWA